MKMKGSTLSITNHSHTKDSNWCAKVLDVKFGSKGYLEGNSPIGAAAENKHVIDININISCNVGCKKRIAGAVAFKLIKPVADQKRV